MPKPESQTPQPPAKEDEAIPEPTPTSPGEQRVIVARLGLSERLIKLLENGGKIVAINGKPVGSARRQPPQE